MALRMVAIICIGAIKLTTQAWGNQSGPKKPMAEMFGEALASLKSELRPCPSLVNRGVTGPPKRAPFPSLQRQARRGS